jgi:hypothetical protein
LVDSVDTEPKDTCIGDVWELTVLEKVVTRFVPDSAKKRGFRLKELKSRSVNVFSSNFQGSRGQV